MHNNKYQKIKIIMADSCKFMLFLIITFFIMIYEFPYYIDTPGGLIDLSDKIEVDNGYESEGSINLSYVLELKATLPTLIISKFKKDWDVIKKEDVVIANEENIDYRDKMLLEEANDNAIITAFLKANKKVDIVANDVYITYIDKDAKTDLEVGDQILEVNNILIGSKQQLLNEIEKYHVEDKLNIKVLRDNQILYRTATLKEEDNRVIIGVLITEDKKIKTKQKVTFDFDGNESGPSGGLMETLYIYNSLVKDDITKGLILVGTGTIDEYGNVGSIGGVEFKLKGAVKKDADIFFVPNGKNYIEAIKVKNEFSYDIKIVGVDTFDDVLNYLKNI